MTKFHIFIKNIATVKNLKYTFWSYIITVIVLSVAPLNTSSQLNTFTIISFRGDYFFHAMVLFPWFFFGIILNKNFWFWLIVGLLFAITTEFIQFFLTYRAFNINDMLANITGLFIGLPILFFRTAIGNYLKYKQ